MNLADFVVGKKYIVRKENLEEFKKRSELNSTYGLEKILKNPTVLLEKRDTEKQRGNLYFKGSMIYWFSKKDIELVEEYIPYEQEEMEL